MTARYVGFSNPDPLDNPIYLDTDILAFYYGSPAGWSVTNAAKAVASQAFLDRCIMEDVILIISSQTIIELRNAIFVGMYEGYARILGIKGRGKLCGIAYRQEPRYAETIFQEIARIERLLSVIPSLVRIEQAIDEAALDKAAGYVFQYHVEPSDAIHIVLADRESVRTFATSDRMWGEVPGIRIYTPHEDLARP